MAAGWDPPATLVQLGNRCELFACAIGAFVVERHGAAFGLAPGAFDPARVQATAAGRKKRLAVVVGVPDGRRETVFVKARGAEIAAVSFGVASWTLSLGHPVDPILDLAIDGEHVLDRIAAAECELPRGTAHANAIGVPAVERGYRAAGWQSQAFRDGFLDAVATWHSAARRPATDMLSRAWGHGAGSLYGARLAGWDVAGAWLAGRRCWITGRDERHEPAGPGDFCERAFALGQQGIWP
ncbi:MAG: hypothetical protein EKK55_24375 [Rhodocyclaceae bacterium]|nr:MAG: hypothetical protein EKK55_24375 [Rhodocyclaceae bacterium]